MANNNLRQAKAAKNDEFYTQFNDIEAEVTRYLDYDADTFRGKSVLLPCDDPEWSNFTKFFAQNFGRLGLRRLVSTSYAYQSKKYKTGYQPTLFEEQSPRYNPDKTEVCGKRFILDAGDPPPLDLDHLQWHYMEGDGDFRSDEVGRLLQEADIVVTNPPFSLFREFLLWLVNARKQFLIIGNINAITYKEVFPLIAANKLWLGVTGFMNDMVFAVPQGAEVKAADRAKASRLGYETTEQCTYTRLGNSCWYTTLEHARRHEPLKLMTLDDNKRYSRHADLRENGYQHYDNYDALEVPWTDAIPADYAGVMGVPISFLDKYCPEQFQIVGATESEGRGFSNGLWHKDSGVFQPVVGGERCYKRIFIQNRVEK